ncbi:MAG: NUDIX hydrolase [Cyanobacterium sp. T60_A2020_053]|nr:NUDIX hydrolase [Cyanobacterium sp. T60_A2020_053]
MYKNPAPTVDIIIEMVDRPSRPIILIERKFEPLGWAIPGGFMDYGECAEVSARREAKEETNLDVTLIEQFYVYSNPNRDLRKHTISIVYIATARGNPQAQDDALNVNIFDLWEIPKNLCFDHDQILQDYQRYRYYHRRPSI